MQQESQALQQSNALEQHVKPKHCSIQGLPVVLMVGHPEAIAEMVASGLRLLGYASIYFVTSDEAIQWLTSTEYLSYEPAVILVDLADQHMHAFLSFLRTCDPPFRSMLIQILHSSKSTPVRDVHIVLEKSFSIRDLLFYVTMAFPKEFCHT